MLRLFDLREDNDLSQFKVASLLNISRSQYSGLELETNRITHDKLITLANFYNTSIDYILGLTNKSTPFHRIDMINSNNLKELRKLKRLTEKEVGQLINLSQQQYSSIENNLYKITHDKLIVLAKFYETSIDYILGLTDEIKPYPKPSFEIN